MEQAKDAVAQYQKENPAYFKNGTDYITKSLGFLDERFRERHPFGVLTMKAFEKYQHLVKERRPNKDREIKVLGKKSEPLESIQ